MGLEIQNSINGLLNTAAAAATMGKHVKQQSAQLAAADAADQETIATTKKAIEADQFEAQQAILAHAKDEGLSQDEVYRLEKDPEYANTLRDTVMTESRKQGLKVAADEYDKTVAEYGKESGLGKAAGENLNRAYERLRELNKRIDATRQLKFDLKSAEQRIEARKNRNLFNFHGFKEVK